MRSDLQLIQSAIGDHSLPEGQLNIKKNYNYYKLYAVELPERFKGLPSVWFFGVLPEPSGLVSEIIKNEIIEEGRELIRYAMSDGMGPLTIVNDIPNIYLDAEISRPKDPVFFLNKHELPGKNFVAKNSTDVPMLLAVKNKFTDEVPFFLSPYAPFIPAKGWRFFGREKELSELVESHSNFFILGARKIGKTSLLYELTDILTKRGHQVHWVRVQNLSNIESVVHQIGLELSPQEVHKAQKSSKHLGTDLLSSLIKKLKSDKKHVVLILDEIGNVVVRDRRNAWNFMGILREFSHKGDIRVIATAFQDVIIKQYEEPDGPFVNFGNRIKLECFNDSDIEEFLVHPLKFWGEVQSSKELLALIKGNFGTHPLILQFVGKYLFERLFKSRNKKVEDLVSEMVNGDSLSLFETAIEEVFRRDVSYLERYVFLKFCMEGAKSGRALTAILVSQRDLDTILKDVNIDMELDQRNFLLERLEMRALLQRDFNARSFYRISSPIVYIYYERFYAVEELCADFLREVKRTDNLYA
jgi:hypothetical protein